MWRPVEMSRLLCWIIINIRWKHKPLQASTLKTCCLHNVTRCYWGKALVLMHCLFSWSEPCPLSNLPPASLPSPTQQQCQLFAFQIYYAFMTADLETAWEIGLVAKDNAPLLVYFPVLRIWAIFLAFSHFWELFLGVITLSLLLVHISKY